MHAPIFYQDNFYYEFGLVAESVGAFTKAVFRSSNLHWLCAVRAQATSSLFTKEDVATELSFFTLKRSIHYYAD